ncbi:MAG: DNA methyltransferase, partial [Thermodesulfobium sp.]
REAITNVNQYLKDKLKESGMSIKEIAEISGEPETQIAHYFRTDESGHALPDREFWDKVKDVLGLEEYDKHVKEEYKSVMLQFNPLGANPGDIVEVPAVRHKSWSSEKKFNNGKPYKHERWYDPNADGGDFLSIATIPHKESHFAVYPETLVAPLINAGCPKGGVVLDPFAGSGTTGVVAEILGRNSILIEISTEYCRIIEERFKPENTQRVEKILTKNGFRKENLGVVREKEGLTIQKWLKDVQDGV